MKIAEVAKMTAMNRFLYWIRERHQIYVKRNLGMFKPWTDDEVMQSFFFTNPYRENDKVTRWFRGRVREPLAEVPEVIFATIAFRWFNLPETGDILIGPINRKGDLISQNLLLNWDEGEALRRLSEVRARGEKVFTGAFMINSPGGEPKLEAICKRISNVWRDIDELKSIWAPGFEVNSGECPSMQVVHEVLTQFPGLGGFMAYEIVCDLRYTYLLRDAEDKMTWCNPGPGAIRGLYRIAGEDFAKGNNASSPPRPKDWQERMQKLLAETNARLPYMRGFEMREIEHSLCEFDKYERARMGDGRMKRTYNGVK